MGQRVLVTGAGGFLGRELMNRLLQDDNREIMALCHTSRGCHAFRKHARITVGSADLTHAETFYPFFKVWKPDVVFHLGAVARLHDGQAHPENAMTVNLLGSIELLNLSARFGVKKFLFTSSDLAREARSVVGLSKLLMEYYIRLSSHKNTEAVVFRMPNLYDFPGSVMDIFARQIADGKDLSITDERMERRFLTREEAADYLLFLLHNGGNHQVFSVKQPPIRIKDIASKMIRASGKNLQLKIIGVRPGEKIYQSSYSDAEAANMGFRHLARLRLSFPKGEDILLKIHQLPVSDALKLVLQSKFENGY